MSDDDTNKNDGLDKLLGHLDAIDGKLDNCIQKMDAASKRLDAVESHVRDDARKRRKAADATDPDQMLARETVADNSDETSDPQYQRRMTDAQSRADAAFAAWGERAPKFLAGEHLLDYRRRLLRSQQKYSEKFKMADADLITDPIILKAVEDQIYADSVERATDPIAIGPGRLRQITTKTASGHTVFSFAGDPMAWVAQFSGPRKYLTRINLKSQMAMPDYV